MIPETLVVTMVLKNWDLGVQRMELLLSSLNDEQRLQEIVPGKNRGIYLVGHLRAHQGNLNPLLGPRLHPELDEAFMHHPGRSGPLIPTVRTRLGGEFLARALPQQANHAPQPHGS